MHNVLTVIFDKK